MKAIEKPQNYEVCPRCSGKGILDWTMQDGGVCYKCEGKGYIGEQSDEKDAYKSYLDYVRETSKKRYDMINKLATHVCNKISGRTDYDFCDVIERKSDLNKSYTFSGLNSKFVELFELPYFADLSFAKRYSKTGWNAPILSEIINQDRNQYGEAMVKRYYKMLELVGEDGFVKIEKTNNNEVTVEFSIAKLN